MSLAPEDEEPLWMDDPDKIQRKFEVWKSVFESISEKEKRGELEDNTYQVFIKSLFFLSILVSISGVTMCMSHMHKKIKLVNNTNNIADNVNKISAETSRINGHANSKISNGIVRIHGFANSKHEHETVKENRKKIIGAGKKILKNETSKNLNEKTTYEISSPTSG